MGIISTLRSIYEGRGQVENSITESIVLLNKNGQNFSAFVLLMILIERQIKISLNNTNIKGLSLTIERAVQENLITPTEENELRLLNTIRNKSFHNQQESYSIESDGTHYLLSENDTYTMILETKLPNIVKILERLLDE